jgi:hypothetical protein
MVPSATCISRSLFGVSFFTNSLNIWAAACCSVAIPSTGKGGASAVGILEAGVTMSVIAEPHAVPGVRRFSSLAVYLCDRVSKSGADQTIEVGVMFISNPLAAHSAIKSSAVTLPIFEVEIERAGATLVRLEGMTI